MQTDSDVLKMWTVKHWPHVVASLFGSSCILMERIYSELSCGHNLHCMGLAVVCTEWTVSETTC